MFQIEARVKSKYGIHARPSAAIAKVLLKKYKETSVMLTNTENNQSCNARDVLEIMAMALLPNTLIRISASGKDEEIAAKEVAEVIETFEVEHK